MPFIKSDLTFRLYHDDCENFGMIPCSRRTYLTTYSTLYYLPVRLCVHGFLVEFHVFHYTGAFRIS